MTRSSFLRISLIFFAASAASFAQQVGVAVRQSDLDFVSTQLPKLHANFFFQLKPADYNQAVQALQAKIGSLTDQEFYVQLAALVAMAGDPHTYLYLQPFLTARAGYRAFPLTFRALDDGIFVTGASAAYARALGTQLVAVDRTSISTVVRQLATIIPHDNQQFVLSQAEQYLTGQQVLQGLDLAPNTPTTNLAFRTRAGEEFTLIVGTESDPIGAFPAPDQGPLPEYMQHAEQNYWFTYYPERRLLYFKYNRCQDMPSNQFAGFAAAFLKEFDANPVDTIVIDFRGNGGGNNQLWNPLFTGLLKRAASATNPNLVLYGIIDKATFSSARDNAEQLRAVGTNRIMLMGAPTGEATSGYGEVLNFALPSGLLGGQYSTKFFATPPGIAPGPELDPDVFVPVISSDYFARHDPVLAAALARSGNPPAPPTGNVRVVNGASFRVEQGVAPGSLASIFEPDAILFRPSFPDDVDVLFGPSKAAIVYAGSFQLNVVVPPSVAPGLTTVSVIAHGAEINRATVTVTAAGPGIFVVAPYDPAQPGAVLNQDSTPNTDAPASRGSIIQIFATGYGPLDASNQAAVQVFVAGTPAQVMFSGPAPQLPGLWQINAQLPDGAAGKVPLYIAAGGIASNAVTVWVQ